MIFNVCAQLMGYFWLTFLKLARGSMSWLLGSPEDSISLQLLHNIGTTSNASTTIQVAFIAALLLPWTLASKLIYMLCTWCASFMTTTSMIGTITRGRTDNQWIYAPPAMHLIMLAWFPRFNPVEEHCLASHASLVPIPPHTKECLDWQLHVKAARSA